MSFEKELDQIKTLFFKNSPILIKESLEGSLVNDQKQLVLGCRAGPVEDVDNLLHEMGHFIEIPDHRILISGWGLTYPEIEICHQICREPSTTQAVERELRVFAIQKHLYEIAQIKIPIRYNEDKSKLIEWMNDYVLIKDSDKKHWCISKIDEYYNSYDKSKILSEWHRKNTLISL